MTIYTVDEIIALVTSVLIGTGAYLSFIWKEKKENITVPQTLATFLINIFVTYLFSELLKIWNWGAYRTLILPLSAFSGQYLMDWFNKRYIKIFDKSLEKVTGLNIEKDFENEQNIETSEEIHSSEREDNN